MTTLTGGCLCGAVRYRLAAYHDAGYCHCTRCRRFTGAPVAAWALARAADLVVEQGAPATHAGRAFCATCGASLYRQAGDDVAVLLGSLDDPAAVAPRIHQCVEQQVPWLRLHDLLPFVEGAALTPPAERRAWRGPADPAVTRASVVSLRPITRDNLGDVLLADVGGHQRRFVATTARSLAQAYLAGDAWHRAIYADGTVVGFVMAQVMKADELGLPLAGDPDLWRFLIDDRYQGLGFGGRALALILDELRAWPGTRSIWLSVVPGTGSAYDLYRRFGFEDTGVVADGEIVMRLRVT